VFPGFYKPTLQEYLDAIALQTKSRWKYDPTSKYFQSEVETGPVEDVAIFEFTKTDREKPFQVTLPKGWRSIDKGNWTMYVPPIFPLGIDIHERSERRQSPIHAEHLPPRACVLARDTIRGRHNHAQSDRAGAHVDEYS
jgi:hypothetical protein